jgi:excisionase family DNA binding protein
MAHIGYYKDMDELLTTEQAAQLLGKPHRTVGGYIERGLLPIARRVTDNLFLLSRADVEKLAANLPKRGRPRKATPNPDATA